jgi:hypothetical protein
METHHRCRTWSVTLHDNSVHGGHGSQVLYLGHLLGEATKYEPRDGEGLVEINVSLKKHNTVYTAIQQNTASYNATIHQNYKHPS